MPDQANEQAPEPRFRLRDALLVIAALAVGFAMARHNAQSMHGTHYADRFVGPVSHWLAALFPSIVFWTMAVVPFGLSPSSWRSGLARPGILACVVTTLVVAIGAATTLELWIVGALYRVFGTGWLPYQGGDLRFFSSYVGRISYAVAACWAVLALSGRWRGERSWVDRLGRAFGVFWIGMIPLYPLLYD